MQLDDVQQLFKKRLSEQGLDLSDNQCVQFETYYRTLVQWNKRMNLTAITERIDVYWKHFFDSLTPAFFVDLTACETVMDVGSGAGFPAFPLKIVFPHLRVTVVDSLKKRLLFLEEIRRLLQLKDVHTVHARAEDLGQQKNYREKYDFVTARAVARLNVLCEYCLPFTRIGGRFVAMKTDNAQEETAQAELAMSSLGGSLMATHALQLPDDQGGRSIIIVRKDSLTPRTYPRKPGTPAKSPLRR